MICHSAAVHWQLEEMPVAIGRLWRTIGPRTPSRPIRMVPAGQVPPVRHAPRKDQRPPTSFQQWVYGMWWLRSYSTTAGGRDLAQTGESGPRIPVTLPAYAAAATAPTVTTRATCREALVRHRAACLPSTRNVSLGRCLRRGAACRSERGRSWV